MERDCCWDAGLHSPRGAAVPGTGGFLREGLRLVVCWHLSIRVHLWLVSSK